MMQELLALLRGHNFCESEPTGAVAAPRSARRRLLRLLEDWAVEGRDSWAPLCRRLLHCLPDRQLLR